MKSVHTLVMDPDPIVRNRVMQIVAQDSRLHLLNPNIEYDQLFDDLSGLLNGPAADHVLLLGIDRPDSKEMQLLERLREERPGLPIVVMTRHNQSGARLTLDALRKGAVEYIVKTKPRTGSVQSREHFIDRLLPVLKAVPRLNRSYLESDINIDLPSLISGQENTPDRERPHIRTELLIIAGCLGGIPALYRIMGQLPQQLPVPVIIVQHMPGIYTRELAEELNQISRLDVSEARDGDPLLAGRVYVAPGGYHSTVTSSKTPRTISLNRSSSVKGSRPSIDTLLKSIGHLFGRRVLLVYLSGGGHDGVEGAETIDVAGGQIIIQNRRTCLLWDLPWRVSMLGAMSYPLERISAEISRRIE